MQNFPATLNLERTEVTVCCTCSMCKQRKDITISAEAYRRWQKGELIQRVMPELSADDRELLISGICGPCFDKLFKED